MAALFGGTPECLTGHTAGTSPTVCPHHYFDLMILTQQREPPRPRLPSELQLGFQHVAESQLHLHDHLDGRRGRVG